MNGFEMRKKQHGFCSENIYNTAGVLFTKAGEAKVDIF